MSVFTQQLVRCFEGFGVERRDGSSLEGFEGVAVRRSDPGDEAAARAIDPAEDARLAAAQHAKAELRRTAGIDATEPPKKSRGRSR